MVPTNPTGKTETPMAQKVPPLFSSNELEQWHSRLLTDRERVLERMVYIEKQALSLTPEAVGEVSSVPTHFADLASLEDEAQRLLTLKETELRRLYQIEAALVRVDKRSYGYCVRCGEEIGTRRLQVSPEAAYCVNCEEEIEMPPH